MNIILIEFQNNNAPYNTPHQFAIPATEKRIEKGSWHFDVIDWFNANTQYRCDLTSGKWKLETRATEPFVFHFTAQLVGVLAADEKMSIHKNIFGY